MTDPHPFLSHFPVAVLALATGYHLFELIRGRAGGSGDLLLALGAAGALASALSGQAALDGYAWTPELAASRKAAQSHADAGNLAVWAAGAAFLIRAGVRLRAHRSRSTSAGLSASAGRWGLTVAFLACLTATVLVWWTAARGGALVHEHGVTRSTVPLRDPVEDPAGYEGFRAR